MREQLPCKERPTQQVLEPGSADSESHSGAKNCRIFGLEALKASERGGSQSPGSSLSSNIYMAIFTPSREPREPGSVDLGFEPRCCRGLGCGLVLGGGLACGVDMTGNSRSHSSAAWWNVSFCVCKWSWVRIQPRMAQKNL